MYSYGRLARLWGVFRRHTEGGAGCGARARSSHLRSREALGSRPAPLRGSAFSGWTGREEGRRKLPGPEGSDPSPRNGRTALGTEIAAGGAPGGAFPRSQGERERLASVPGGSPPPRRPRKPPRFPALCSPCFVGTTPRTPAGEASQAPPGPSQTTGRAERCLLLFLITSQPENPERNHA